MTIQELKNKLEQEKRRSAWGQGVLSYAWELFDNIENALPPEEQIIPNIFILEKMMLNGADNWHNYSWGGCSLIYDSDIAEHLCAPWELKRTDHGRLRPNRQEKWLDVQARALFQAAELIKTVVRGC